MKKTLRLCVILLLSGITASAVAAVPVPPAGAERPRIGLVLGGGGARGLAHIGVLKMLEELRIPVDYIAGTSMGALVAGAYASGLSVAEMEALVNDVSWADLFDDSPPRQELANRIKEEDRRTRYNVSVGVRDGGIVLPQGLISGQKLDQFLEILASRAADVEDFDQLPIPFRAVATRLIDGEMIVFDSGSLFTAMRASMSIPGVIAPVEVDGTLLVDGGLARNVPVDLVREMGADVVIAINVGTPPLEEDELTSALAVTAQMLNVLIEKNITASINSLGENDVLIQPPLGDLGAGEFARSKEAIAIGAQATNALAARLARYSVSAEDYQSWRARRLRPAPVQEPVRVDEIRVEGLERGDPRRVLERVELAPGDVASEEEIRADITRIYGTGDYELVTYRTVEESGRRVLIFDAIEKSWGPNYLRLGLNIDSDFQNDSAISLAGLYKMTQLDDRGAEWRNAWVLGTRDLQLFTEYYQPLSHTSPFFVAPYAGYVNYEFDVFAGDQQIAEYTLERLRAGVDLGLDLKEDGELRLGVLFGTLDAERQIGAVDLPDGSTTEAALTGRFVQDQLDDLDLPKSGYLVSVDAFAPREWLGADEDYLKLRANWLGATSHDGNILLGSLELGASVEGSLPLYDQFTLGGFLSLSGLRVGQLRGDYLGFGRLAYLRRVAQLNPTLGAAAYLGTSLEVGNVWQDESEIGVDNLMTAGSLFLALDTFLGALYLGYGYAEGGEQSAYLYLGRPY